MKIVHDPRCTEYSSPRHPERPARVARTVPHLQAADDLDLSWEEPVTVDTAWVLRAHDKGHFERVQSAGSDFDLDTPAYPEIGAHALRAVGSAVRAMRIARDEGRASFSLMRPPGHHATRDRVMGFCYLNSMAIALLEGQAGGARRVAVFYFDVHHGNGTEDILKDRKDTAFFSIHQHPCYPGTGTTNVGSNCFNFPVPPGYPRPEYRATFAEVLKQLKAFKPDLIGVSAGFDAYARDPLAQETLEAEDFEWLGAELAGLGIPTFSILEGGYSNDLPVLIHAYLRGLARGK